MPRERRFTDTLGDIREGAVVDDLTLQLRDLVQRVRETGRPGTLTLVLKVKSASKGGAINGALIIEDDIKTKLPVAERGTTVLFATEEGQLQRHDPRQPRLVEYDEARESSVATMPEARNA